MSNQEVNNQFRTQEIFWMSHFDKKTREWIKTAYFKVGGRLRFAHGDNGSLCINTNIIHYDDKVAVVRALATTSKGQFTGLGMASVERDQHISPTIF